MKRPSKISWLSRLPALWAAVLAVFAFVPSSLLGHDPRLIPPEPVTAAEAWNVIGESVRNVDQLLETGLLSEIATQVANTSPCLRLLDRSADESLEKSRIRLLSQRLIRLNSDIVLASREKADARAKTQAIWKQYREALTELETFYSSSILNAAVYICPMHPAQRDLNAAGRCPDCGMALVRRRIPASTIYEKPGEPSIRMSVQAEPLQVGKRAIVRIHLSQSAGGAAVRPADLVLMHTRKIHLLINDASLSDYHHEHPEPIETPGDYVFSFTPARPGPYRIWADVVPIATSIQEYVIQDIPAATQSNTPVDKEEQLRTILNGRRYELVLFTEGKPVRAGETIIGRISVSDLDGKPFTQLEPVMGAFAHIVGFCDDSRSILHIHPLGAEPTKPTDRGGPTFTFKLYVPRPGFLRLYGQVQIDAQQQFPQFGLNVLPAEK